MATTLQIDQMTLEEKLRVMEALWDDLCQNEQDVPVPRWHTSVLEERERLVSEGRAKFTDWDTAKKRIDEQTS